MEHLKILNKKINQNQLTVTKADEVKSKDDYCKKTEDFMANNHFEKLHTTLRISNNLAYAQA
jgi:hypothetical protein